MANRHERRVAMAMVRGKGNAFQAEVLKADIRIGLERERAKALAEQAHHMEVMRLAARPWWRKALDWVIVRFRK